MPRRRPPTRLADLADAAVSVFIQRGYRRTQVSDVAEALGVAKGTVYLYVKSKEALFDLAIRRAAGDLEDEAAPRLPLPTPKGEATLRFVRDALATRAALPILTHAAGARPTVPVREELRSVVLELYDALDANRVAIKLVDRCSVDYPELAALWFGEGRGGARALFERYFASPGRRKVLRPMQDPAVTSRIVIELLTFWAVHRHWDPAPQAIDPAVARETLADFVLGAVMKDSA